MSAAESAAEVTARSRSNLAFSFLSLPADVRRDMEVLYAFCRTVDDIADESALPVAERRARLRQWREALGDAGPDEPALAAALREMSGRRALPVALLAEILDGVEMDLDRSRYETLTEVAGYCHRVAGCVGLASLHVFGCNSPETRSYALELGNALQWTNILRDVARDLRERDRVYLPREELARVGLTDAELPLADERFTRLMVRESIRAQTYFDGAVRARRSLTRPERRALAAAEVMRDGYQVLLNRMRKDQFRVFERDYRLGPIDKLLLVVRSFWRRAFP